MQRGNAFDLLLGALERFYHHARLVAPAGELGVGHRAGVGGVKIEYVCIHCNHYTIVGKALQGVVMED